ncbi:hypothetical protein DEH84_07055 [Aquabacterium olei]|uniref:Uncharacterized protein n=1 Tax=Aquabacterium olei TaxID=1296669 RepID=A0A2U8FQ88_9BURK|nr:hypothetical protein [Aquabacterium olei]AWI53215.1 hypothetical protein DEH84_07055 [Aquabacterium olei]
MFEAYAIGVRLSLINNVTSGLTSIIGQFQTFNSHLNGSQRQLSQIESQLLRISRLTVAGGALAAVGGFGLGLFKGPLDAAREYETAYARFKTLNLGDAVNQQADSFARGANKFGTSAAQMMDTFRESYAFFGNMSQAQFAAGKIGELNAANAVLFGGRVSAIDGAATKSLMRFADMRGATNSPEDFFKTLNLAQRMVTGSGGSLKFNDLEAFAKTGGTAFKSLSDEGIVHLGSAMQEMGGSRTGTALMTMYQNLVAGRATKQAQHALANLGLANLEQIKIGEVGGKTQTRMVTNVNPEFLALMRTDPVMALSKYMMPAINSKLGLKASDDTEKADQLRAKIINDLFSDRTGSNLATGVALQMVQVMRDSKFIQQAMGVDKTIGAAKKTTDGQMADLTAKWRDTQKELGLVVLPIAIKAAEKLRDTLQSLTDFAREHPKLTKAIALSLAVVSGLAMVGGGLLLMQGGLMAVRLALGAGTASTLGALLTGAASGLGLIAAKAGLLAGAGYVGYKAGTWLNDNVVNPGVEWLSGQKGQTLGGWVYDATHSDPMAKPDRFVRGGGGRPVQVSTQINLDGRKVASVVTKHQANEASRPFASAGGFDPNQGLAPLALSNLR